MTEHGNSMPGKARIEITLEDLDEPVVLRPRREGEPAPSASAPTATAMLPSAATVAAAPEPLAPQPAASTGAAASSAYRICTIRDVFEGPSDIGEGLVYPVPGLERDSVVMEPRDGTNVKHIYCTALDIRERGAKKPMIRAKEIRAQILITDARMTIACSKYEKGGGWWGIGAGALVAVPLNVGSKMLAARRRRGKMLVGQIRYPWISGVFAQNRSGWSGSETLCVFAGAGGGRVLRLLVTLPKDLDATAVGTELIQRAAAFRLAHDDEPPSEEKRARLIELCSVEPLTWVKGSGKMAGHNFPNFWPASERSARFGLSLGPQAS